MCLDRIDHLIRALPAEATDQRIAGTDETQVPTVGPVRPAAPYQLDMFRQSKNFDFAELLRIIPIQIPQWQLADLVRG